MSEEVHLPKPSAWVRDAVIVAWLKKEGDALRRGEPLLQIETDKTVIEIESPANGVLTRIIHGKGARLPGDTIVALIE